MTETTLTIHAESLEQARELARPQVPLGLSILSEEVHPPSEPKTLIASGKTMEEALAKAKASMPAEVEVMEREELSTAERIVLSFEARDADLAKLRVKRQLKDNLLVESFEEKAPPQKLMGFVRKHGQYEAVLFRPAKLKITYQERLRYTFTIGTRVAYESIRIWGRFGADEGHFYYPVSIALDAQDNVYVTDNGLLLDEQVKIVGRMSRVQKFDNEGHLLAVWGSHGEDAGQFLAAQGVAVDAEGYVYIADGRAARVQKFSPQGEFVVMWGSKGKEAGQFGGVMMHLALAPDGSLYVSDQGSHCIHKFDAEGSFLTSWGTHGGAEGQFVRPQGIAVNSQGQVYVADSGNNRVQKFDAEGNFLTQWGSRGEKDGQFKVPRGIAVDLANYVYVSEAGVRVQKFDTEGNFVTKWGSEGKEAMQLDRPEDLAVGRDGHVYVLEYNNSRIQVFG